jgi:hypothetical protein
MKAQKGVKNLYFLMYFWLRTAQTIDRRAFTAGIIEGAKRNRVQVLEISATRRGCTPICADIGF